MSLVKGQQTQPEVEKLLNFIGSKKHMKRLRKQLAFFNTKTWAAKIGVVS